MKEKILKYLNVEWLSVFLIALVFSLQFIGIKSNQPEKYTPYFPAIILFATFLFFFNLNIDSKKLIYCALLFVIGMTIEIINTRTGWIMGWIKYSDSFGIQIMNVSIVKGLLWMLFLYGIGCLSFSITHRRWIAIIIGAFILLILDIFIEPISCKLEFWCWLTNGKIPLRNFLAVFVMGIIYLVPFSYLNFKNESRFPVAFILCALLFFACVNVFVS